MLPKIGNQPYIPTFPAGTVTNPINPGNDPQCRKAPSYSFRDAISWLRGWVMFPRVKGVRYIRDYRLELSFTDGITRELDLKPYIAGRGGVFRPLEDPEFFQQVQVDSEAGTIVWPNGVDSCPDVLYSLATNTPIRILEPA